MPESLLRAPLTSSTVHLCIDMQNIFAPGGPWETPWLERVAPVVTAVAERFTAQTVFTRFITPARPEQMPGTWQRYYPKWRETTRKHVDPLASRSRRWMPKPSCRNGDHSDRNWSSDS